MSPSAERLGDIVIVGGGCYGTFYARQLQAARDREKLTSRRVILVDRDPGCQASRELEPQPHRELVVAPWDQFFRDYLARPTVDPTLEDTIVPSPLMPHLMADWLVQRCQDRWPGREGVLTRVTEEVGTPYDAMGGDGNRYISFADWICPTHCVEPAVCPMIKAPRTWEMSEAVNDYTGRLNQIQPTQGPALFITRHRAYGVGMFGVEEARRADRLLAAAGASGAEVDFVIGTVSACHGAISILRLGEVRNEVISKR